MTDPVSTTYSVSTLLAAAKEGIGSSSANKGLLAILTPIWRPIQFQLDIIRAARWTARRCKYPGVKHYLKTWCRSGQFEYYIGLAASGELLPDQAENVAESFVAVAGASLGWGHEALPRAQNIVENFLRKFVSLRLSAPNRVAVLNEIQTRQHRRHETLLQETHSEVRRSRDSILHGQAGLSRQLEDIREDLRGSIGLGFPESLLEALAGPGIDTLSRQVGSDRPDEALLEVRNLLSRIDEALGQQSNPGAYLETLRPYRQKLHLLAGSAADQVGDREAALEHWRHAKLLGRLHKSCQRGAIVLLFNLGLREELESLLSTTELGSDEAVMARPLLAFLDKDWDLVDTAFADEARPDRILMRVYARSQIARPIDVEYLQETLDLLSDNGSLWTEPLLVLKRASLTLDITEAILDGYTPLSLDRRQLLDSLLARVESAILNTQPNSLNRARAIVVAARASVLLKDGELREFVDRAEKELDDEIRDPIFVSHDPPPPPEVIDELLASEKISVAQAIYLKFVYLRQNGTDEQIEIMLREALEIAAERKELVSILHLLCRQLLETGREATALELIQNVQLRPSDRWLLLTEFSTSDRLPIEMVDEVLDFDLNVEVVYRLAESTVRAVRQSDDAALAAEAAKWTQRLVEVLPARGARLMYAEALFRAGRFADAISAAEDLDQIHKARAVELTALALDAMDRRAEAVEYLANCPDELLATESLAVCRSALLLKDGRPQQAEEVANACIQSGGEDPRLLVNLARARIAKDPGSKELASEAFELLRTAYERIRDPGLAQEIWLAARGAGREREAGDFFMISVEGAPTLSLRTTDDLKKIFEADGPRIVSLEGGLDILAEEMRAGRERMAALLDISAAHVISYADRFRITGRSWEEWTSWTEKFLKGGESTDAFSVLADWPTAAFEHRRKQSLKREVLADPTAILTLGVLGPETAREILNGLEKVYVAEGTLGRLREERARIESDLLLSGEFPYEEVYEFIKGLPRSVVEFSDDLQSDIPSDSRLGPAWVDISVALKQQAIYVSDLDDADRWPELARGARINSAQLLRVLNHAGEVDADSARQAADLSPENFGKWETAELISLPDTLVLDQFALVTWAKCGVLASLRSRLKVGPWAWSTITQAAESRDTTELAYERLDQITAVLRDAQADGTLEELAGPTSQMDPPGPDVERSGVLMGAWATALESLVLAKSNELQLWADDRFFALLLWSEGPTVTGPETDALRSTFVEWASETPPVPTFELLDQLSQRGLIDKELSHRAAFELFRRGYRPAHAVLLDHVVDQYPVPSESDTTAPYQDLADSLRAIPTFLPQSVERSRRAGFTRIAAVEVAERLLERVWTRDDLTRAQRTRLSDLFLEGLEGVFSREDEVGGPTSILFWNGIFSAFQLLPTPDEAAIQNQEHALVWLVSAVAKRKDVPAIVRVLEDNLISLISIAFDGLDRFPSSTSQNGSRALQGILLPAMIVLGSSELVDHFDLLLRRSIGIVAGLPRHARVDAIYDVTDGTNATRVKVSEEEIEERALDVLRRIASGDKTVADAVRGLNIRFTYRRQLREEEVVPGIEQTQLLPIPVDLPLLSLLESCAPDLRPILGEWLVHELAVVDPQFSHFILERTQDAQWAAMGESLLTGILLQTLRSGYFETQRDIPHALWRLRNSDPARLDGFLGWIGESGAKQLESINTQHVVRMGNALIPLNHFAGRTLLAVPYDDNQAVLELLRKVEEGEEGDGQEVQGKSIDEWIIDLMRTADESEDPWIAALALSHILLCISVLRDHRLLTIRGSSSVDPNEWAIEYLRSTLSETERSQLSSERSQFASNALEIAAYVCSGKAHVDFYGSQDDPDAFLLDRVWLLASKLYYVFRLTEDDLPKTVALAEHAKKVLGIERPDGNALDFFDPYAIARAPTDLDKTLALAAVHKALASRTTPSVPSWWPADLTDILNGVADASTELSSPHGHSKGNRFMLRVPLTFSGAARAVLDAL